MECASPPVTGSRTTPSTICAMLCNPYGGRTLAEALEQVAILTNQRPTLGVVDRRYRGYDVEKPGF